MSRPLAIDLFCGLGGWTEGLLAEGYDVVGFDNERHEYGEHRYPGLLVIQDVRTLHGSQFKNAALIVASPPCQAYSYRAMPWKKAKALPPPDNTLFETCFRIQREACEAAGRHIPLIVENVRGAQKWVGRARWNFGSFYLWGDVPALMPITLKAVKVGGLNWKHPSDPRHRPGQAFNPAAQGQDVREARAIKNTGGSWFNIAHNTTSGKGRNPDGRNIDGVKVPGRGAKGWFGSYAEQKATGTVSPGRMHGKNHPKRKFASAMIAKIPLPLSRHIAATFHIPVVDQSELVGQQQFPPACPELPSHAPNSGFDSRDGGQSRIEREKAR
jgi:hypothetical protein